MRTKTKIRKNVKFFTIPKNKRKVKLLSFSSLYLDNTNRENKKEYDSMVRSRDIERILKKEREKKDVKLGFFYLAVGERKRKRIKRKVAGEK